MSKIEPLLDVIGFIDPKHRLEFITLLAIHYKK